MLTRTEKERKRDSGNFDSLIRPTCCDRALENKGIISNMIAGFGLGSSASLEVLSHPAIQPASAALLELSRVKLHRDSVRGAQKGARSEAMRERGEEGGGGLVRGKANAFISFRKRVGRSGVNSYSLSILGGN